MFVLCFDSQPVMDAKCYPLSDGLYDVNSRAWASHGKIRCMFGGRCLFSDRDEARQRELYSWPAETKAHFRVKLNFGYPRDRIFDFTCPALPDNFFCRLPAF